MALEKKVHSYFNRQELEAQLPIQNNGKSAQNIAQVCGDFLAFKGKKADFMKTYKPEILKNNFFMKENRIIITTVVQA